MRKICLFFLLFICSCIAAQDTKHWVQFRDKNNSPYSISAPSDYLSARALQRRANQGIAIDSADLPVNPSYVSAVAATGAYVHARSRWLNGVVIFTNDPAVIAAVSALPFVASVSGIGLRKNNSAPVKNDEETFGSLDPSAFRSGNIVSSNLNYGASINQISMLGGVCLHNNGFLGQNMQIAVIDAGFGGVDAFPIFDTLWANNRILGTWDFVEGHASVYENSAHGMMVLSCMGGYLSGELIGTAPEASYWLLRSEEGATEYVVEEYYWAAAAEFADSVGADLINSSLGYTEFDDSSQNHTYADMDGQTTICSRAANFAARKGIAVIGSAGNSGQSPWFYISAPADADSALAVGSVDAAANVSVFSSRGPAADGAVKPNVAAQGEQTVIASQAGGTQTGNGTSFASPVLCGLVACLWQANPSVTNMQLLQTIQQNASRSANPDSLMGYGIPDFCRANQVLSGAPVYSATEDQLFLLSPNPFFQSLQFSYYSVTDQDLVIRLYDAQGRMLIDQQFEVVGKVENNFTLQELGAVAKGVYFLELKSETGVLVRMVVKGE
ncbi:MAG TPA: S8 family serine peptidase [Bacteroidia bacterium]|nr:S8 family serine peptidase [Bacteroidia bacterium]